jgi:hypothetical protein
MIRGFARSDGECAVWIVERRRDRGASPGPDSSWTRGLSRLAGSLGGPTTCSTADGYRPTRAVEQNHMWIGVRPAALFEA